MPTCHKCSLITSKSFGMGHWHGSCCSLSTSVCSQNCSGSIGGLQPQIYPDGQYNPRKHVYFTFICKYKLSPESRSCSPIPFEIVIRVIRQLIRVCKSLAKSFYSTLHLIISINATLWCIVCFHCNTINFS